MKIKGKILFVGSSADTIELKDGRKEVMGYYLNELAIPVQAAIDAGYEIVLATPKGEQPIVGQHSLAADHFGGSEAALQKAFDFVATNPGIQNPRSSRSGTRDRKASNVLTGCCGHSISTWRIHLFRGIHALPGSDHRSGSTRRGHGKNQGAECG
jgi:hypothetical protein